MYYHPGIMCKFVIVKFPKVWLPKIMRKNG